MNIQGNREPRSEVGIGLAVLVVGILIGSLARPTAWLAGRFAPRGPAQEAVAETLSALEDERPLEVPMAHAEVASPGRHEELDTLIVELDEEAAARLQAVHDRSLNSGMIVQSEGDLVPASLELAGKRVTGKVRIKGDYLDHLNTDKWSLRVECKEKLAGMSRFSVQHPKTRGFLWEWLVMQAARGEGLLAPRCDFVNVVINGNDLGIYYLEEHFTKELIESQGRREGPIVRFDESVALGNTEQYFVQTLTEPVTTIRTSALPAAEISAFGEKRLAQSDGLARQLQEALEQMSVIQKHAMVELDFSGFNTLAQAQARLDLADREIDGALDVDLAARMHALLCLFRCNHGLAWKNRRFYHNPVTARLEPIVYDTNAGYPIPERDPLAMFTYLNKVFLTSAGYRNALYDHVARMSRPGYVDQLFAEHEDDLRRFSALMAEEGIAAPQSDVAAIKEQLYDQQVYLRELLRPRDVINFDTRLLTSGQNEKTYSTNAGDITVEAWAVTEIPTVLRGFRFSNGRFVSAKDALERFSLGTANLRGEPGALVMPSDGRRVHFRFPADHRLATLRDVQEVKQAALEQAEQDKSFKLKIVAEYRLITEPEPREELLWIRRFGRDWGSEEGRPDPLELRDALDAHDFLRWDADADVLWIEPGVWDVQGDLVVPDGYPLHAGPGVSLRFSETAALISGDALVFEGSAQEPIELGPQPGVEDWQGVCVIHAPDTSTWKHTTVRDTLIIQRGGWMMTGGITFYRSPVELFDCAFHDAHGEDALNIFGTDFLLERVLIDGVASDAFDGDFVRGTVRDCTIMNSVEDAVDFSGSDVDVVGCRFIAIGDKGISAGEDSVVRAENCVVESASIAAASKDYSRLTIDGIDVQSVENYAFAVYIKKPEFGPSSIIANNVKLGTAGLGEAIVQETCELVIDGRRIEGQPLDVKELYRQKILGK